MNGRIEYSYLTDFRLECETELSQWINRILEAEGKALGDLVYIFCSDDYLLQLNQSFLGHDTFTDIITFPASEHGNLGGDIFISVERVGENADLYQVPVKEELLRVMAHGILHMAGYDDKTEAEICLMREKEEHLWNLWKVKQPTVRRMFLVSLLY